MSIFDDSDYSYYNFQTKQSRSKNQKINSERNPNFKYQKRPLFNRDNIIYTVNWRNKDQVVATWTNRVQNKGVLVLYDTQGKASHIHYEEETEGWLRIHPPLYHNEYVIILKPQDIGTQAGRFLHPTRYVYNNGILTDEKDLTPKSGEVNAMLAVDHVRGRLYYLTTLLDMPSQRHLYSVQIDGTGEPFCVSCSQISPEGEFPQTERLEYRNSNERIFDQEIRATTRTRTFLQAPRITRCLVRDRIRWRYGSSTRITSSCTTGKKIGIWERNSPRVFDRSSRCSLRRVRRGWN